MTPSAEVAPTDCVVNFDNLHTLPRARFRRVVATLSSARMAEAGHVLTAATGC